MALVGSGLVLPVMLLTFFAAFVPLVGATVAGIVAVLVTLATEGLVPALIVGIVAIVVQQLDNDILAPWIYGKSLSLHPAVVLLAITTGTALFGFVGTVLAVPITATVVTAVVDLRELRTSRPPIAASRPPSLPAWPSTTCRSGSPTSPAPSARGAGSSRSSASPSAAGGTRDGCGARTAPAS